MSTSSRSQHCMTLSSPEAWYVALAGEGKVGLLCQESLVFYEFKTGGIYEIETFEGNEGGKPMA